MSQIASAYTVSTAVLEKLATAAASKQFDQFWQTLFREGREVTPAYSYSGYVVAVAVSFVSEQGIALPLNASLPATATLTQSELSPVVVASMEEAREAATRMAGIGKSGEELQAYFEEFTADEWDESAKAMREALDFIKRALTQPTIEIPWCLMFVG